MRFVAIRDLKPGMILGKTIHGSNYDVLLTKGTTLKENYISNVARLNFPGLYIDDAFSKEVEISDVIAEELRTKSVQDMKNIFIQLSNEDSKHSAAAAARTVAAVSAYLNNIVDEIISNKTAMVNLLDIKTYDLYTFQHSVNVAVLSIVLGSAFGLRRDDLYNLGMAALFHDIGKTKVPSDILNKNGRLTPEEYEIMKNHPRDGFLLAKEKLMLSAHSYVAILQHHEKFDGTGYPSGKTGDSLLLFSRIIATADVYDAITTKRPYHDPILPSEAIEYIMANAAVHFDPEVVNIFIRKIAAYPLGMTVVLSNGLTGIVVENYTDFNTRPKIKILTEDFNDTYYIDLKNDESAMSLTIVDVRR